MHCQCTVGNEVKMMIQTIRIGKSTLAFATTDSNNLEEPITYTPYVVKSGISMAANLREAFKDTTLLTGPKVQVMIDSKVLMVPIEQFSEEDMETLYRHSFPQDEMSNVVYNVLPDLNTVALFSINKDLQLVLNDRFSEVKLIHVMAPVWRYLHQRSFTGHRSKLYGYFHDRQLDIFSFQQNRFKFCNSFETANAHDALYFLLYVWKQLNLQPEHDELHLVGDIPEKDTMLDELRRYLQKAFTIHPATEFNKAPATQVKGMPFDLMTLFIKGR
mgnify:CR=1 FL=1